MPLIGQAPARNHKSSTSVAELFIAFGRQLGDGHALLYIRVVALQLLELQSVTRQWLDQLAKTLIATVQTRDNRR